jgi:hypothetical protein
MTYNLLDLLAFLCLIITKGVMQSLCILKIKPELVDASSSSA